MNEGLLVNYFSIPHATKTVFLFEHCVQTLLEAGRLPNNRTLHIQQFLSHALAAMAACQTMGDSNSLRVEAAHELLQSLLYTLGSGIRKINNPAQVESCITGQNGFCLENLQQAGKEYLGEQLQLLRSLWRAVKSTRISTTAYYYNTTLQRGIASFLSQYDATYAAHDTPGEIDYHLSLIPFPDETGVVFMLQYLNLLLLENRFCRHFSPAAIHRVLSSLHSEYTELLLNLFEPVFLSALGCVLCGQNPRSLSTPGEAVNHLYQELHLPKPLQQEKLHQVTKQLCNLLNITDSKLTGYLQKVAQNALPRLQNALVAKELPSFFHCVSTHQPCFFIHHQDGFRMNNQAFRQFAEELKSCRHLQDKLSMLQTVKSATDLIDLLDSDIFSQEELPLLFKTFDEWTLATLIRQGGFEQQYGAIPIATSGISWQKALLVYLNTLPRSQQSKLFAQARTIN